MKRLRVLYFAQFRDCAGVDEEWCQTTAATPAEFLAELRRERNFPLPTSLGVAVDECFVRWDYPLRDGATVAFIPPVGGG